MSQTPTHRPARRAAGLISARSHLTAGIAALGVGAIALAPVQPVTHQITAAPERVVSDMAVGLAAAVDPIAAWVNVFQTSTANIEILGKFNEQNPFPLLQTVVANLGTYAAELEAGQGNLIPEQIWNNIVTFFEAPWDPGTVFEVETWEGTKLPVYLGTYLSDTTPLVPSTSGEGANPVSPAGLQVLANQVIVGAAIDPPADPAGEALWELIKSPITPLLEFLNTPYSGQVISWLGPLLAPAVALTKSFTAVGQYFQEGKVQDALYELINIPANMTNAFLNGAGFLNLTPVIGQFFDFPEAVKDVQIGFNVGGLLNAMPQNGSLINPDDPPTEWAGGTGLDSFAIPGCGGAGGEVGVCDFIEGQPPSGLTNGLFGAGIGLGQFLAEKLLVTPPAPPTAAAEPEAAKVAAPLDVPAPALTEAPAEETAPAVVDVPAAEDAPAVDKVAEETAPAVDEELAEETAAAVVDIPEVEAAPADVADDPAPKPAATTGSDDAGDTGSRATESRRGASDSD